MFIKLLLLSSSTSLVAGLLQIAITGGLNASEFKIDITVHVCIISFHLSSHLPFAFLVSFPTHFRRVSMHDEGFEPLYAPFMNDELQFL